MISFKPSISAFFYGVDGSRTRVQKTIPCTSTGLVNYFGLLQSCSLSARRINTPCRLVASSYAHIRKALHVSFPTQSMPESQCVGALSQTAAIRQRMLNFLQRLFLICHLTHCIRIASPSSKPLSKPVHPRDDRPLLQPFIVIAFATAIYHKPTCFQSQRLCAI